VTKCKPELDVFIDSLPAAIGQDIIAASSDLHYINVHTTKGKALVLGSLKYVAEVFGDEGMMTHRGRWIIKRHVERVKLGKDTAYCLMSNGLRVPISRSRRKTVSNEFGRGAVDLSSEP